MTKMKGLGVTAAVMIGIVGLQSLFGLWLSSKLVGVLRQTEDLEKFNLFTYLSDLNDIQQLSILSVIIRITVMVLAAVFFSMWMYRGTKNLWGAGLPDLKTTPGWSVGWWFIPVAFWFMPLPGVIQLWKGSVHHSKGTGDGNWRGESLNPLVIIWWVCWVAGSLLSLVSDRFTGEDKEIPDLILSAQLGMASSLAYVAAAGLAVFFILRVSSLQDTARAGMFAAMRGGAGHMAHAMMPQPGMAPMGQPVMHPARAPMAGPAGQPMQAPMRAPMRAPGQPMMNPAQARQGQPMQPRPGMQPGAPAPRPGVSLPQPRRPMPPGGPR